MESAIKLNFVNLSKDNNNSSVLIFQKNVNPSYNELAVAWKVIKSCGIGSTHPFDYFCETKVCAIDSYGNHTYKLSAEPGQAFEVKQNPTGNILVPAAKMSATNSEDIEVVNSLLQGSISAAIYRNGKLVVLKKNIVPQEKAVFQIKPTIWIGHAAEIEEGAILSSAIISRVNTEISLLGIAAADIEMTGGGMGIKAQPYKFSLNNIEYQ